MISLMEGIHKSLDNIKSVLILLGVIIVLLLVFDILHVKARDKLEDRIVQLEAWRFK